GWARVAQTRISIIAPGLTLYDEVVLGDFLMHRVRLDAVRGSGSDIQGNLKITAYPSRDAKSWLPLVTIDCWFGLDILDIFEARVSDGLSDCSESEAERLREWLLDNPEQFQDAMLPQMLSPFKYKARLYGERADRFFGPVGSSVSLRLALVEGHEV